METGKESISSAVSSPLIFGRTEGERRGWRARKSDAARKFSPFLAELFRYFEW